MIGVEESRENGSRVGFVEGFGFIRSEAIVTLFVFFCRIVCRRGY